MSKKDHKEPTKIIHSGYDPEEYHGVVNPPITRVSSIVYPSLDAFEDPNYKFDYGRNNTPQLEALKTALTELEQGDTAVIAPCGLTAITVSFMSFLKTGDHMLVADSVYYPVRRFCNTILKDMGIETTFYDPYIGGGIVDLIQDNTCVIFMESPGSCTFDVQDVPAIVKAAKARDVLTMLDNTWASGLLFKPLEHGVDLSILSCTKYINGYADGMLGAVVAQGDEVCRKLKRGFRYTGLCAGSEEINLAIRGLKTIHVRMKEAGERGLKIAQWLEEQEQVQSVYYPALESHPGHDIWKRDFSGANGILSCVLKPASKEALRAFLETLEFFPLADSWGGYESLCQPQNGSLKARTAVPWEEEGWLIRIQVGLEDTDDLIDDLAAALKKYGEAS